VEAGTPPGDPPIFGVRTVTLDLDAGGSGAGPVEVALAVESDPCSAASLEHLAGQGFYDGTVCHELSFGALRCGDPSGTGEGGPTYSFFAGTNIPAVPPLPTPGEGEEAELPLLYPAGTVAFGDSAGEGGSQFMIFYRDFHTDAPLWSIIGEVTAGMPLIEAIGAAGTQEGAVAPAETVTIRSLRVTDPDDPGPVDQ
jgi:peptidyl-prolyl cis-trans isomerase B (cyclophilin B)